MRLVLVLLVTFLLCAVLAAFSMRPAQASKWQGWPSYCKQHPYSNVATCHAWYIRHHR